MFKLFLKTFFLYFFIFAQSFANDDFSKWLKKFQTQAINSGVSKKVVYEVMSEAKFLPKVIEYDRFQPEFYEDTFTYIKKRSSNRKIREGLKLYKKEKKIIEIIEKEFELMDQNYLSNTNQDFLNLLDMLLN